MHRDISAGNCLLTRDPKDGPSFISDFELAKEIRAESMPSDIAISVSEH
jgi:serine/threonine protein kinase